MCSLARTRQGDRRSAHIAGSRNARDVMGRCSPLTHVALTRLLGAARLDPPYVELLVALPPRTDIVGSALLQGRGVRRAACCPSSVDPYARSWPRKRQSH